MLAKLMVNPGPPVKPVATVGNVVIVMVASYEKGISPVFVTKKVAEQTSPPLLLVLNPERVIDAEPDELAVISKFAKGIVPTAFCVTSYLDKVLFTTIDVDITKHKIKITEIKCFLFINMRFTL